MAMASNQPAGEGSSNMEPVSLQPVGDGGTAGFGGGGGGGVGRSARGEYFECRTCNRRFASFQALGGHRTGHTRQAQALQRRRQRRRWRREQGRVSNPQQGDRRRVHGCVVCGLEFSMGQALGGHMRRHRNEAEAPAAYAAAVAAGVERPEMLDLNSPPADGEGNQEAERSEQVPRLLNLLV